MTITTISLSSALDNHYRNQSLTATTATTGLINTPRIMSNVFSGTDTIDVLGGGSGAATLNLDYVQITTDSSQATGNRSGLTAGCRVTQISTNPIQPN